MSLRVLIVEDEHLGLERLERQLISLDKNIQVVGKTDSVSAAVAWLQTHETPDLIMMDIDLGDGQSFEIFRHVQILSHVIFTTSYDEHALHAFESNNIDHLLKPIKKSELLTAIDKHLTGATEINAPGMIDALVASLRKQLVTGFRQQFLAREGKKIISVELHQVTYFFSSEERSYLRTLDKKKLQIEHSIDEIELSVNPSDYFRVNENWILARGGVVKMNNIREGGLSLQLRPSIDKPVLVPKEKAAAFKSWVKQ